MNILSSFAKSVSQLSQKLNLGNGSTWPGHLALMVRPTIVAEILSKSHTDVVLIIGTNGKTTTAKILTTILESSGKKVIQNTSGANLLNGVASTLLLHTNPQGKVSADYAVFEVDENNVPLVLQHVIPKIIIALDLFRDQLDRYGELDSIAKKWNHAFKSLTNETTLVLNADDPLIAYVAKDVKAQVLYFGLPPETKGQKKLEHASDSIYCPNCGHKLVYDHIFFSHLGIWHCTSCGVVHPKPQIVEQTSPLPGVYNLYNTYAAVLAAKTLGIAEKEITNSLEKVIPAFGRQEKLTYKGSNVQLFLSKNPTSMNQSLVTIASMKAKHVLFVLNDRIPDGHDVSWIWDIDIENFIDKFDTVTISGDRAYDMGLRLEYTQTSQTANPKSQAHTKYVVEPNLTLAVAKSLEQVTSDETLYVLPTYSAMLDVRKILTGRKIL
ncbi:MAG TPA: MurT ligase domain-containing protein [Patescibacteria group bacterium]|nr:MurT ligase domain-containing protein [Patescibacteria group bacterium]